MNELSEKIKAMTEKISLVDFVNNYFNLGDEWLENQNLTEEELNFWARTINYVDEWGQEYVNIINNSQNENLTPDWILEGYNSEEEYNEDLWKMEADEEIDYFTNLIAYLIESKAIGEDELYSIQNIFSFLGGLDELQKDLVIREIEVKLSEEQWNLSTTSGKSPKKDVNI